MFYNICVSYILFFKCTKKWNEIIKENTTLSQTVVIALK